MFQKKSWLFLALVFGLMALTFFLPLALAWPSHLTSPWGPELNQPNPRVGPASLQTPSLRLQALVHQLM